MASKHIEEAMEEQDIDLTPLIDCFLMLIIFFSCLEFKSLEAKLPAYLPKDVGAGKTYVAPQEKLSIKILCDSWGTEVMRYPGKNYGPDEWKLHRLENHVIHWEVGAKKFSDVEKMKPELERLCKEKLVDDEKNPGQKKKMTVVIEPGKETTYDDVARTVDVVLAAKFEEINFGGGLGARKKE
jgi:hypothetical protein